MNFKLLLTVAHLTLSNFFIYSMQPYLIQQRPSAQANSESSNNINRAETRNNFSNQNIVHNVLRDNYRMADELQAQVQTLNILNERLNTDLENKTASLTQTQENLEKERALLIEKLEKHTELIQKIGQDHKHEIKEIIENHKQEVVGLHKAHTRDILITFLATGATAVGITWLLHKFKIIN